MQKNISKWCNAYLPPILWASVIYALSAQGALPSLQTSSFDFFFKKFAHMFVYAVLFILLYRGVNLERTKQKKNWLIPFLICLTYAGIDEFHQMFTPGRHPTFMDIGYDALGMSIAFLRIYRYI